MAKTNYISADVSLVDNLDLILKATDEQIEQALIAVGAKLESNVKSLYVPVDTGRLKNSITYALGDDQSVYVGTNVEYAEIVEEGTSGRMGRHYLRDAVNNHIEEYKSLVERALSGRG